MSGSVADQTRYETDLVLSVPQLYGTRKYQVELVTVTTTGGSRPGFGGTKTVSIIPLTNRDGYVHARQVSAKEVALSGNLLTERDWSIGPFALPYDTGTATGGTDPSLFAPVANPDPVEMFIRLTGEGMAPGGSYFRKQWDEPHKPYTYRLYVRATAAPANV